MNCVICNKFLSVNEEITISPHHANITCFEHRRFKYWWNWKLVNDWIKFERATNNGKKIKESYTNRIRFSEFRKELAVKKVLKEKIKEKVNEKFSSYSRSG